MSGATQTVVPRRRGHERAGWFSDRAFAVMVLSIGLLIGLRIVATAAALPAAEQARVGIRLFSSDAKRYHEIAEASGAPYRDVAVEVPPAALGFIEVINGPTVGKTMGRLGWASFVLDMLTAGAVAYGWGRRALAAYLVLALPLFYLPFIYFRIDLLSVALAAWGWALLKRRSDVAGGTLLAVAVFAKLWPLALLPILVVERRWKALAAAVSVGAAGALVWLWAGGIDGMEQVLTFRHARGWQVESVTGGIIRIFTGDPVRSESGAVRFGSVSPWMTALLALALTGVVAAVWIGVRRRLPDDGIVYGVAPLASVGAFMVCSPLLSPQYVIWLLPFTAIAWAAGHRQLGMLVVACFVTTMVLPNFYARLNDGELSGHLVLNVRNTLLVVVVVYATMLVWRSGAPLRPRSTLHEPAPLLTHVRGG